MGAHTRRIAVDQGVAQALQRAEQRVRFTICERWTVKKMSVSLTNLAWSSRSAPPIATGAGCVPAGPSICEASRRIRRMPHRRPLSPPCPLTAKTR